MAMKTFFVVSMLLLAVYLQTTLGNEVKCEKLDKDTCAFAVSSTGKRCVLEQSIKRSGIEGYTCRSSEIEADKVTNIIESDECIKACGLDRKSLGISSDALLESRFTQKLCSVKCLTQCPNVVDLFFNLAAGEGVYLPKLCESQEGQSRRAMSELRSSGIVRDTLGPVGPVRLGEMAPEPATSMDYMPYAPAPEPATSMDHMSYAPAPASFEKKLGYNCGDTNHSLSHCPLPLENGETKFASCFVCKEHGDISKNCPQNKNGVYPMANAASGMAVEDECKLKFLELKAKRNYRFIIFRIDGQQVVVEKLGSPEENYDDFSNSLPANECRYAVYDFDFTTAENCQKSKIFFIAWSPDSSRVRMKMVYASSKDRFKRELDGIQVELQATDPSEMSFDIIKSRAL
ncbi:unnamed protein product [Brassica rapa]|uniref:ADF-H domain-containing protein n=2 Tax=Brassica TaxID=3705 RepID=A0A8D9H767_BRACM|nr:unnamed protein product [Brassica napus]CAG7892729.1 unnamed protein product [Brassica rapa]